MTRWTATIVAAGLAMGSAAGPAAGQDDPVPDAMLGLWALDGQCDRHDSMLVVTPQSAILGVGPAQPIVYYADDAGPGVGAVHWAEEYQVDNFVYLEDEDAIVHNVQGYNMPGAERYERCR